MIKYPQSLFIRKITARIAADSKLIIDAPCGTGQTSYELANHFTKNTVIGADISQKNIETAKKKFNTPNLSFQQKDIHSFVEEAVHFEVFCLINSLFLLPQPQLLLQKIKKKLRPEGKLLLILPNPESTNFKRYQKLFPEVNTFILEQKAYKDFFAELGFKITHCEGIARVPIYGRFDTKLFFPVRDSYLFFLEKRSKSKDYGYYLVELKACA